MLHFTIIVFYLVARDNSRYTLDIGYAVGKTQQHNNLVLAQHNIPTIKTYALGKTSLVMEDISVSENWRLGVAEDLADIDVAKSLAHWYFTFHENGATVSELDIY